jgi:hypothetical protein
MIGFVRRAMRGRRPASDETVPDEFARALDASAEDLRHDRTEDLGDFLKRMRAKLDAHLTRKAT